MMAVMGRAQVPARPAITGIAFVRVYSSNPVASQAFYGKELGYDLVGKDGVGRYPVNEAQWIEVAPMPSPAPPDKVAAIGFTTRDVGALLRYMQARHVTIVEPLHSGCFGIHDPEGRLVEFVQQGAARDKSKPQVSPRAAAHRIIHTGFTVPDRKLEDSFYVGLLGFKPYWYGGRKGESALDYVSMQVPDGTDWVEYMLDPAAGMDAHQLGGANHMSLGVAHIQDAIAAVKRNTCQGADCPEGDATKLDGKTISMTTHVGRNGAVQFNLFDPDVTRAEYMEFNNTKEPCCSPYTGPHPREDEDR
jgi:catechol 2,3-dioxygenase-like lactoylglutathione lyase family enzyme